jgi:hypothetical protein
LRNTARGLHHPKQVQDDQYNSNHEQGMDPIAGLRDSLADILAKKAQHPQNDQNYDDCPQHEISPLNDLFG